MKTRTTMLDMLRRILPVMLLFAAMGVATAANSNDSGYTTVATNASAWLNVAGYIMLAGAGLCFIYAAYKAFQQEWSSAAVGLIVCLLLGFAPTVLGWAAQQWGITNGAAGLSNQKTLFIQ